jgi:hypothetical protein
MADGQEGRKGMKKISILLMVGIAILLGACDRGQEMDIWSDVGRYQVLHYTSATTPPTDYYLRVDTQTGRTELFYRDGDKIKYMDSFSSPEIEDKKDLRKS